MQKIVIMLLLVMALASITFALPGDSGGPFYIQWNANTEADRSGYLVYWDNAGGEDFKDTDRIWVSREYEREGLLKLEMPAKISYGANITVSCVDASGNESDSNGTVFFDRDGSPPASVGGLLISEGLLPTYTTTVP